ncbi:MAG: hypothetical protein KA524_01495 [Nitrosomonas sp.]|nr:hypothetical protein [Nitrosomonas sp.]MBP6074919.1 hypothetical protein [Nitrosomonas sp.]
MPLQVRSAYCIDAIREIRKDGWKVNRRYATLDSYAACTIKLRHAA